MVQTLLPVPLGSYMLTLAAVTVVQNIAAAAGREGSVKCASPARCSLGAWRGMFQLKLECIKLPIAEVAFTSS